MVEEGKHAKKASQTDRESNAKDVVADSESALKQLALTPREASATFHRDSQYSAGGKRSRNQYETPSPHPSSPVKISKNTRALWSPPQLKRSTHQQNPRGPSIFEIADCFPTLEGEDEHRDDVNGNEDLAFARRLKMKPVKMDHHEDLAFYIP